MKLSDSEKQKFGKIYEKLKLKNNGHFSQKYCENLMVNRCQIPEKTAQKVINFSLELKDFSFLFLR